MATLNVGSIAARLGLDTSDFIERMKGATGATKYFSAEVNRSMKQTSREGAESMRLLDDMLGIKLPRSMSRLLSNEFPAFAAGLQSILGVGVVGVLVEASAEFGEKIAKSIEKAQKAQEELHRAIANTNTVLAEELGAYKAKDKAVTAATAAVDKLADAEEKQAKAAQAARALFTSMEAAAGDWLHKVSSFQSTLDVEAINKRFSGFIADYNTTAFTDSIDKTRNAAKLLATELATAESAAKRLNDQASKGHSAFAPGQGVEEQAAAMQDMADNLKRLKQVQDATFRGVATQEAAAALEKQKAAVKSFYQEIASASAKITPDTDPIHKLEGEITTARLKAVADFDEMRKAGASALNLDHALAAIRRLEASQDRVLANAKATAAVAQAQAELPTTIKPTGQAPTFAPPTAMAARGADAKFDTFAGDQAAQLKRAAEAYELAMTARDKYALGVRELDLLVQKGLISSAAQKAALNELDQQLLKAASSAQKMRDEMQKLLEKSNDASAGLKAYAIQLQINAEENGKFIYDVLTSATKSAEDDAAKSLMAVLEEQRGGHRALIHELEAMWSGYFKNIATMGMKNMMDRALGPVGAAINRGVNGSSAADDKSGSTSPTKAPSGLLGWLMPKQASANGASTLNSAGTLLSHAAAELTAAAAALRASSSMSAGSASADAGGGGILGDFASGSSSMAMFASGGDATPGSSFISGEAGAEEVNLDGRGGAHITPLGMKTGGDTHIYNDFSGSIMTDDLMRRAEGMAAIHANIRASEGRMLGAIPTMQREIALRKRS